MTQATEQLDEAPPSGNAQIDPLAMAGQLLGNATTALLKQAQNGRLSDKIALAHALAAMSHAQSARGQLELMYDQVVTMHQQLEQAQPPAGGIVVPR